MEPRFNDNLAFLLTDGKASGGVLIVDEDRTVEWKLMIEIGGYWRGDDILGRGGVKGDELLLWTVADAWDEQAKEKNRFKKADHFAYLNL